eukprot:365728-Chlamydomonas_euryale.AAC.7
MRTCIRPLRSAAAAAAAASTPAPPPTCSVRMVRPGWPLLRAMRRACHTIASANARLRSASAAVSQVHGGSAVKRARGGSASRQRVGCGKVLVKRAASGAAPQLLVSSPRFDPLWEPLVTRAVSV